jgi:hypothetical protein
MDSWSNSPFKDLPQLQEKAEMERREQKKVCKVVGKFTLEERKPRLSQEERTVDFGFFKLVFTDHAIERLDRVPNVHIHRLCKHKDSFKVATGRSAMTTMKHGFTVYLSSVKLNALFALTPDNGKLAVTTVYSLRDALWSRKMEWVNLEDFDWVSTL